MTVLFATQMGTIEVICACSVRSAQIPLAAAAGALARDRRRPEPYPARIHMHVVFT